MKSFLCVVCVLFLYHVSFGQGGTNEVVPKKVIIKFSTLSYSEGEPVAQVGVEYIFKPKISFQQQLGYVYWSPVSSLWGVRSRSELRAYFKSNGDKRQGYIAAEALYKFLQNYGTKDFWRSNSSYIERVDFRANRNTFGFMPKIGWTSNVFVKNFAVDFAFGIGAKATYYNSNVPGDASLNFNNEFLWNSTYFNRNLRSSGYEVLPNFLLSLQIGFVAK